MSDALSAEDAAFTPTAAQLDHVPLRLRYQIQETGGGSGDPGVMRLQYSQDQTHWIDVQPQGTAGQLEWFQYVDGAAVVGDTLVSNLLSGSTQNGTYVESQDRGTGGVSPMARREFDACVALSWLPPNTTVYLRLTCGGAALPGYITVTAPDQTVRPYTVASLQPATAPGYVGYRPDDFLVPQWPRLFHDQFGASWAFGLQQDDSGSLAYYRKAPSGSWSARKVAVVPGSPDLRCTSTFSPRTSAYLRDIGGRSVVVAGFVPVSGDQRLLRGSIASGDTDITWNASIDLGSLGISPMQVVIDQGGYIWLVGCVTDKVRVYRSTQPDDGSATFNPTFGPAAEYSSIGATTNRGVAAVPLESNHLLIMWHDELDTPLTLLSVEVSGSTFSNGATVASNARVTDWGLAATATKVHCVYVANASPRLLMDRIYDKATHTWSDGPPLSR